MNAPIAVLMGVSASGKTTVGRDLAKATGWTFQEGDDLHPPANVAKMRAGIPLTDADRAPWLEAIGRWIDAQIARGEAGVITCSALKRAYRDQLRQGRPQVRIVYLHGDRNLLAERIADRRGHFMPPSMLDSQLATLEAPAPDEHVIVVEIDQSAEAQAAEIQAALEAA